MKKNLSVAVVILFVCCFTSLAFAGLKAPKTVCWGLSGSGYYNTGVIILNFKKSGMKTKTKEGLIKFYHVQGGIGWDDTAHNTVFGTAVTDIVDGQIEGQVTGGIYDNQVQCNFYINPDSPPEIYCQVDSDAVGYQYSITELNCSELSYR